LSKHCFESASGLFAVNLGRWFELIRACDRDFASEISFQFSSIVIFATTNFSTQSVTEPAARNRTHANGRRNHHAHSACMATNSNEELPRQFAIASSCTNKKASKARAV